MAINGKPRTPGTRNLVFMATYKDSPDIHPQPLLFNPLVTDDTNFLEWLNDVKVVLAVEGLSNYMSTETAEGLSIVMK